MYELQMTAMMDAVIMAGSCLAVYHFGYQKRHVMSVCVMFGTAPFALHFGLMLQQLS